MTEQEAFEAFADENAHNLPDELDINLAKAAWRAALAWARSQQEPIYFVRRRPADVGWEAASKRRYEAAINAGWETKTLYTHPAPIPEGWQLVPKEPTREMMRAFWLAGPYPQEPWAKGYKAMLAAAPKPEK